MRDILGGFDCVVLRFVAKPSSSTVCTRWVVSVSDKYLHGVRALFLLDSYLLHGVGVMVRP